MSQILLRSNRRFGWLGVCCAMLLLIVLFMVIVWFMNSVVVRAASFVCMLLLAFVAWQSWRFTCTPRAAIEGGELLLYVRSLSKPVRLPLEAVEVFFMGQGAVSGDEPGHPRDYRGHVAANVVVRLAESEVAWHRRSVNPWLAVWADGYVTLRGLWCENIDQQVLSSMNSSLIQAKRALREGGLQP